MTTIKTDDLTPRQINMLVAVAEGWVPPGLDTAGIWQDDNRMRRHWSAPPSYCSDNRLAGPIIDRERITTIYERRREDWSAGYGYEHEGGFDLPYSFAPSRLQAAMRAYVRKVHGDTIDTTDKPWLLEAAAS